MPDTLTSIGDLAFYDSGISNITLPKSITSIGNDAFCLCRDLESIELPDSLAVLDSRAFNCCFSLISIDLPNSLENIESCVFLDCEKLSSVYIPLSVKTIYQSAFLGTDLKDIYYAGTEEQWNAITIRKDDEEFYNFDKSLYNGLVNATVHYNSYSINELENFVVRLYRNFLKREPDDKGLADWIDALQTGRATGAMVVCGFVFSPEYQANILSDEEYVTAFYRIILNREPDEEGFNRWLNAMKVGCTFKKVLSGFINSKEFENLCSDLGIKQGEYYSDEPADQNLKVTEFVSRLYEKCLGRKYERAGLDNWVIALLAKTVTGSSVVRGFFGSREFNNRHLDDKAFVTVAYRTILGRDPDEVGLSNWIAALSNGFTRSQIVDGFLGSVEFGKMCAEYGIAR